MLKNPQCLYSGFCGNCLSQGNQQMEGYQIFVGRDNQAEHFLIKWKACDSNNTMILPARGFMFPRHHQKGLALDALNYLSFLQEPINFYEDLCSWFVAIECFQIVLIFHEILCDISNSYFFKTISRCQFDSWPQTVRNLTRQQLYGRKRLLKVKNLKHVCEDLRIIEILRYVQKILKLILF